MLKNIFKSPQILFIFLLILIVGLHLRAHNLITWPRLGATFDEYAWTWQGVSLIQDGMPQSWSYHPQYKNRKEIKYQKATFILVKPYLEHPPLFGLVAGSYALLTGSNNMFDINIPTMRGLALILGALSITMVFFVAGKIYGPGIGLLSSLLYAVIPTIAVGSRIVQNENFFIPMWLLSIYFAILYLEKNKSIFRNIAIIIASLLILSKIPWIAAPFSIGIIFLFSKKYKDITILLISVLAVFLAYFLYGFYYDREVFLGLWGLQLNRYDLAFDSIYALFQKPYLADRYYTDGWIFWGWISFVLLLIKDFRKNFILISVLLSYFLVFLAGIPDESGHGWYRYPFYPFLAISIALFIKEYFAKNWVLTFLFLVFVGTTLMNLVWTPKFGFSYPIFRLSIISWALVLVPLYISDKKIILFGKIVSYSWLIILIMMSIRAIIYYNEM